MSIKIKVYGVFKQEMLMPYLHETLLDLYSSKEKANDVAERLNNNNQNPMEEDSYGPLHGCKYFVAPLEIK